MAERKAAPKAKKAAAPKKTAAAKTGTFVSKQFQDFTITKKRHSGYLVKTSKGKLVNGADKAKILLDSGVVKLDAPSGKKPTEESAPA